MIDSVIAPCLPFSITHVTARDGIASYISFVPSRISRYDSKDVVSDTQLCSYTSTQLLRPLTIPFGFDTAVLSSPLIITDFLLFSFLYVPLLAF